MYTSIFRKRFIIRDWLTWLWRLRSPQTCSRQAGDQGGQWCKFQFKSQQAWNPRRADVSISVQRQETTNAQLSQAALIEGGSAFFLYVCLQLIECHIPEVGRFYAICKFKCSFHPPHHRHTQNNVWIFSMP